MSQGSGGAAAPQWRHFQELELTPILSVALDTFYEKGFHGTTVREVARGVGQTVPVLYYHHESKEGMLVALLEISTGDLSRRVRAAAEAAGSDQCARLVNVVEAVVLHMTRRTRLASLDSEIRHLSVDNRKRYAMRRKEIENLMNDIVGCGAEQGIFAAPEPAETARALLGMCQSIARWYNPEGPLSPADVAARYVDIATRTVGAHR
jgi:AcrR family transcriptional regulator